MIAIVACVICAGPVDDLLTAIERVETGGMKDPSRAVGDGGRSLGPMQIQRAYWTDSRVPGRYDRVQSRDYARRVVLAYWSRFCPRALAAGDRETLARVHNGGPAGARKPATRAYWAKVRSAMRWRQ